MSPTTSSRAGRRLPAFAAVAGILAVLAVLAALALGGPRSPRPSSSRTGSAEASGGPASAGAAPVEPAACRGVRLHPGVDLQAALRRQPEGASFCFSRGVYRLAAPLVPKARQRLVARPGAVLSGARVVKGWQRVGDRWRATGQLPAFPTTHGECKDGGDACRFAEAVFLDDRPLQRVTSLDEAGPGRVYADYRRNAIWVGDDPGGHVVEVARAEAAVAGRVAGVVVDGFVVERFANPAQHGAIHAEGRGWQVQRNDIRWNHGVGLFSVGARVRDNHVHHNGQLGLGGGGDDQLVEGNEINHNNTEGFSPNWEAGGAKWVETSRLVVRANNVHHNQGPGLWTDINNVGTLYEGNVVHANATHGIFHEISYRAVIRNNRVTGNGHGDPLPGWGGSGIRVAASPDVDVHGNLVAGNRNAIMLVQQVRTDSPSPLGPHELRDVEVHDNQVTMPGGLTGMVNDTGDDRFFELGNRFRGNTYRLPSTDGDAFAWLGRQWDWTAWRQRFGQDTTGELAGTG
jgi:hypothetical protein